MIAELIDFIGNAIGEASRAGNGRNEWTVVAIIVFVGIVIVGVLALIAS